LGIRVPGVVISPWLKAGVDEKIYDHSSVPRTANDIFNLKAPYLGERAPTMPSYITMDELLDEPRKDCPMTLPDIPSLEK